MEIKKIWLISFSPTGTSKKAIKAMAEGIVKSSTTLQLQTEEVDLTYPGAIAQLQIEPDELALISVPVYAGRVPGLAVDRLAAIKGAKGPAVVVVTYGNREYEDALIELSDLAEGAGFEVVAACSFIGEHSFSGAGTPIAAGRPDEADNNIARGFGEKIFEKIRGIAGQEQTSLLEIPGNRPYKEGMGPLPFTPQVDLALCNECELCIPNCPAGAISLAANLVLDPALCIFCCACVKGCPEEAVTIEAAPMQEKRQWLFENCVVPKKPGILL